MAPRALATGWVSHTLFEPSIGNEFLQEMANITNLEIAFNAEYEQIKKDGNNWVVTYRKHKKTYTTRAKILIDATEIGELLPLVGGRISGWAWILKRIRVKMRRQMPQNSIVQDLTYVLILEDVSADSRSRGNGKKGLVKKPKNYNPKAYECAW